DSESGMPVHQLAEAAGHIPEHFLSKVLRPLVDANILSSLRGPHGGYRLIRRPRDVSLLDIIEAVEGPIRGKIPLLEGETLGDLEQPLQSLFDRLAEDVRTRLAGTKLTDLARKKPH